MMYDISGYITDGYLYAYAECSVTFCFALLEGIVLLDHTK